MRRIVSMMCVTVLVLTGCSGISTADSEPTATPSTAATYTEEYFVTVPDELLDETQGTLLSTELLCNQEGEPAIYQMLTGYDDSDDEYYAQICEYTLNSAGDWETEEYFRKPLSKLLRNKDEEVDMPYISRGDDGNLYALLQIGGEDDSFRGFEDEEKDISYSLLVLDENTNKLQEIELDMVVKSGEEEKDYASEYSVTDMHISEDGTLMIVFDGSKAMWFDSATGARTSLCESISDSAFGKDVGYGESEIIYYSTSAKKFRVLDAETLSLAGDFGDDISEEDMAYQWYFYADTQVWQMYAFNLSGLYRISDFGSRASTTAISSSGNFDDLSDATIYDVMVGDDEALYVFLGRTDTESASYEDEMEYGVALYTAR